MRTGPGFRDWLLAVVTGAFVVAGAALLLAGRGGSSMVACVAFFGLCFAASIFFLREKLRQERSESGPPLRVTGGERRYAKKGRLVGMGLALMATGAVMAATGGAIGPVFIVCAVIMGAAGAVFTGLLLMGRVGRQWIAFEPEGLFLGGATSSYVVHWENIARVGVGDVHGNSALVVWVSDRARVIEGVRCARGEDIARARDRVRKMLSVNQAWMGGHVFVMTTQFGLDAVALCKAVERFAADSASRAELAPPG